MGKLPHHISLCLLICVLWFYSVQGQFNVPQYLKTKYGQGFGTHTPTGGVKSSFTKTKTKTVPRPSGRTSYSGSSYSPGVGSYSHGGTYSPGGGSYSHGGSYSPPDAGSYLPGGGSLPIGGSGGSAHLGMGATGGGMKYIGGCTSMPPSPMNAGIRCSSTGCTADCIPRYQFPNGATQATLTCQNAVWQADGMDWTIVPACEPICLPQCQNNGICMAPNQCNCPENFSGPQCQFENKPCLNYPAMPVNSRRSCRSNTCTITCVDGHQFPDGSAIATMICKNGLWVPAKEKWTSIPDCKATCNPPCLNGGNCLSFNVCQCPQEFRGPQCQYEAKSCSAKNLQFNGAYNCSGDSDSFSCSITCPEGIKFQFPPEHVYTCYYEKGVFEPSPMPQCDYPENLQIIPQSGSSHTFYLSNQTAFDLKSLNVNGKDMPHAPDGTYSYKTPYGRKNKYDPKNFFNDSNIDYVPMGKYGKKEHQLITVEQKLPKPGTCFTWGGTHHKTFDGKVFSFDSKCAHVLVRDGVDNTFSVVVQNSKDCYTNPTNCHKVIKIYLQDKQYFLKRSDNGFPIFASAKKVLPIPGRLPGLRVEMSAHYIVVSLDSVGAKLKWDGQQLIQVEVKESLWNRTEGLCGKIDGDVANDGMAKGGQTPKSIVTLATSWKVEDLEEVCNDTPTEEHACLDSSSKDLLATKFCEGLLTDKRFQPCHKVMDTSALLDACRWDYCSCKDGDPTQCACETLNVYVRDCSHKGITGLANWRDDDTCPMTCTGGRIYKSCGPAKGQPVCGAVTEIEDDDQTCVEGCYCPDGTVLHENKCITKDKCPCKLRGKSFAPGASVPKECNTCTCNDGQWVCTQVSCGARCSAVGDPHYLTFDGKRYDFMGQCSYYLVKTNNFSIEAENVACAGSISQAMNFPASVSSGLPSCTKAVTIKIAGQTIKLKQNHDVVVNGQDISKVPYKIADITIRSASSIFLIVELPNGIEVWWDGVTRAYIDVPASFKEKTRGLCGTFNNNQKDDFLTPEDDIEQAVIPFANKWKTSEKCSDIPEVLSSHPCDSNIHNKATAEKYCQTIKSDLFKECHWHVDPDEFYQNCMYDMCACEFKVSKCLCPTMAAYAAECSRKGIKIDWRNEVRECGVHCPGGQKYQVCGNSCTRTCSDVATRPDCRQQCVEGCNCPLGEALDENGECIPIGQCKCQHDGLEFSPGYKEVRPASKGQELCTCMNALWRCLPASAIDVKDYPKASDLKAMCKASANMEFTTCEPVEPVTCKNMHSLDFFSASVCHAGCKCKEGYVLDTKTKHCVKPTECPCHHGGRSYGENATVQSDCNTCKCQNGKWTCTDRQCSAECNAWGDSHYKTFDGKHFDYQGQCDYVLAKGSLGKSDSFDISIQNVPCGSLGTSCSKSVTIRINSGQDQETITLTKDKALPQYDSLKHMLIRQKGLFVIIEVPDLGLVVHWDRGTRVYVKVDPRWKDKIKGLCGNYNDNEADDFQTPSGGMTEVSAKIFGDSWRLQSYCPEALEITNTCEDRPDRKVWALKQCGIMKSGIFAPCHSEVPLDNYFDKCVFDSCACDQGGDCECLCTALAAYAQECNNRGVPIKWRNQQLCPMQCDERCAKYSPCISTCPAETCDNLLTESKLSKTCGEDTCVEGCSPKLCPPNHVYLNSSLLECVPRNICKPFCMEIDGVTYYEGDLLEEDNCHSCYCSRTKKICKGQPCSTIMPEDYTTHQLEQFVQCKTGWTSWINQDKAPSTKSRYVKKTDVEPLPTEILLNNLKESSTCDVSKMVDIECRTVRSHVPAKKTGLDVECSLEKGLLCKALAKGKNCPDFEIRVKCQCEEVSTTPTPPVHKPCNLSAQPHEEHPTDCHLFYHCEPSVDGPGFVEKTCGVDMMYNPQTMVCDWPQSVITIKPDCGVETLRKLVKKKGKSQCPPDMVYEECAIECDKLCLYYSFAVHEQGLCEDGAKCSAGCVSADKNLTCPAGMFWINPQTCVSLNDCMCRSIEGKPVKPGQVVEESICKKCQCIDNYYSCHEGSEDICEAEADNDGILEQEVRTLGEGIARKVDVATLPPVIIPSTVTPPKKCDEDRFIDLIQGDDPLSDDAFSASSFLNPSFAPYNARLDSRISEKSGGSWTPQFSNKEQYLQIDLPRQEPVYGAIVRGSPLYEEYVTSYRVLYSPDGYTFYYVLNDEKHPQIFRGSIDTSTPVRTIFETPFEAKSVKINPQTWNNEIALRVELIGCGGKLLTTTTTTTTAAYEFIEVLPQAIKKLCEDTMGVEDGRMADQQISTSSELSPEFSKKHLKLYDTASAWQPLTNSPTEWVQFDFLEPRNITGFVARGGPKGWVTSFAVKYSHNKKDWNPILDDNQKEKVFLGNINNDMPHINNFELPINTRYIKIIPTKWHKNIQMRIEMLGCYEPYPEIEEPTTPVPTACNTCPGTEPTELEMQACRCKSNLWWDGTNCVTRPQCPCMVGHIPYAVGSTFEEEDCSQCVCKLGGVSHCTPKKCDKCPEGLRSTVTSTCACTCKPCPDGTTMCPTSNICINSTLWCNGVQDCPDDELDCATSTPEVFTTVAPTTTIKPPKCPVVQCEPGYKKKELNKISKSYQYNSYLSPMISSNSRKAIRAGYQGAYKGVKTGGVKGGIKRPQLKRPQTPIEPLKDQEICKEYKCVSNKPPPKYLHTKEECPPIICQVDYIPVYDFSDTKKSRECPRFSCYPPTIPDAVCNVTGRTFNTFDDTEYKYDICNHILARDLENDEWDVSLKKNCTTSCSRDLIIRHEEHLFILHPDLSVEFDGYRYTVDQTKKIGSQSQAFSISQLGNTLLFASNRYGFWVVWNTLGNVKLGVVHKLVDKVDGLCGYFNDDPDDDKRKPDGSPARSTVDFGDSWAMSSDQPLICEAQVCPILIQNKAWEMCNKVKDQTLSPCARVVDIEAFISRCLETTCACLEASTDNHTAEEICRCQTMQAFVVDCLTADAAIDLSDWRMKHDCPATCDSPLVYHDCYQRKCEPTCQSISDPNVCPKIPNVCFPGCYCPPGHVRKGETCIKPSSCRDCECNVLPHLQYVTYDENNFTVNGNCVYVMSRDILLNKQKEHKFQVLVTNAPCIGKKDKICVGKITVLYEGHKIHVLMDPFRNKLKMVVDGERLDDVGEVASWANVRETATKHYKILLTDIQVEVSVYFPSLGVSVKAPSHKYGGKMEGLCGDCNGDVADDIKTPTGATPKDLNDFTLSWLYEHLPGGQSKEMCDNKPPEDCPPLPVESDPCIQLVDINKFGQCLNVLDPMLFLEWCRKDTCGGHPEQACIAIEAYARDCASAGFCINWRTDICRAKTCPADQRYDPCGTNCPKTCENIKEKKGKPCKEIPVEGCYCTDGKVLLNNTCVLEKDCEVCDEEGHHPGDKWKKDKCTDCTCEGTALKCETQHCPGVDTVCNYGYTAIKLPSKTDECCDKYACVPEPTAGPTCETPQKLVCGAGQILKLDTKPNGCQTFICECKPVEDCDKIDMTTDQPLEPGYVKEIDDSGCCPLVNLVCKPDLCPEPKECPQYHNLKTDNIDGKCCPLFSCEPPKDKCIFDTEFIASDKGGERQLTRYEKQKLLKNANETWNDGPCRQCKCRITSIGNYQPSCSQTQCPAIESNSDNTEYELKAEPIFDKCCPDVKRAACKYDGKVYKVGEKWIKENDKCVTFECVDSSSGIQKETQVKSCDKTCDLGHEYVEAAPKSPECCGSCKPVACVVDGVVHKVGAEWSSKDHCTNFFCLNLNGSMQVQSIVVNCPELPDDFILNFQYEITTIDGECCKNHTTTACKVGKKVYKVDETWPSPDGDKCKTVTCVEKAMGELVKQESIETCKMECLLGWEYEESNTTCCGECIQTACVVGDELKKPDANWTSPDGCTIFSCEHLGDQFVVSGQQESCPSLDDCPDENIYVKGCCKHCNLTSAAQTLCSPEEMPLDKTVGLIKAVHYPNGNCINKKPIYGFTECVGTCHSSTFFNAKTGMHESVCSCCQAKDYKSIEVEMECDGGLKWMKKVAVPSKCGCEGCAAAKNVKSKFTKSFTKH